MEKQRIIIMTESSKFSGKCVAGIDVGNGEWVRLVSDDLATHGAIANKNLLYSNGTKCQLLDIVDVPIIRKCADDIQPENVLLDTSRYIEYVGQASIYDVLDVHPAESRYTILGNKYSYISEQRVDTVGYSLTLVQVTDLEIVQVENVDGRPKTKANFTYNEDCYTQMSVTDPRFYSVKNGTQYANAFLVISIGTPYNSKYYKFIAGIYV